MKPAPLFGRPETGTTSAQGCPFVLDVEGTDQHAENARLRGLGRAVRVELPDGVLGWIVPHHSDLKKLLVDPRVAKGIDNWDAESRSTIPDGWPLMGFVGSNSVINAHGDSHRRLRGLVDQALTPARAEATRGRIRELVDIQLDRLAHEPREHTVDLRTRYAYHIPTTIISELLGIPKRKRRMLFVLTGLQTRTDNSPDQVRHYDAQIGKLLDELIEERRADPQNDLISDLIAANRNGEDQLSGDELNGMVLFMFFAGHQSVINVITNTSHALLSHPDQLAAARSGEVSWRVVIEEAIRWNGAVNHFPMRYPLEDIEIGGVVIPKGEPILASFGSAGRDPEEYGPAADDFDIHREPKSHLGFGYGPHFCLGIHLARLQLEFAVSRLFLRFPDIALAAVGDAPWKPTPVTSFVSNSIQSLPVVLGRVAL